MLGPSVRSGVHKEAAPFGKEWRAMNDLIRSSSLQLIQAVQDTLACQAHIVKDIATAICEAFGQGNKVLLCGNGGSAADCQHLAAEFVNRFRADRSSLPAIALTTDSSILTSIANDYSFQEIFSRQVEALGRRGDMLFGISTSGRSENVLRALEVARGLGIVTVGFTGKEETEMSAACDYLLQVQSLDTPRIQEVHIFVGHLVCDMVERQFFKT